MYLSLNPSRARAKQSYITHALLANEYRQKSKRGSLSAENAHKELAHAAEADRAKREYVNRGGTATDLRDHWTEHQAAAAKKFQKHRQLANDYTRIANLGNMEVMHKAIHHQNKVRQHYKEFKQYKRLARSIQ